MQVGRFARESVILHVPVYLKQNVSIWNRQWA